MDRPFYCQEGVDNRLICGVIYALSRHLADVRDYLQRTIEAKTGMLIPHISSQSQENKAAEYMVRKLNIEKGARHVKTDSAQFFF